MKQTQNMPAAIYKYVPMQNFTDTSDIDWTQSIAEIEAQLYKKYNLSPEDISFIETNVAVMSDDMEEDESED